MYSDDMNKELNLQILKDIYTHLSDEKSKEIFETALMYSITGESKYAFGLAVSTEEGRIILDKIKNIPDGAEIVLFGSGLWGKEILEIWKEQFSCKCIIDNNPKVEKLYGVPVRSAEDFLCNYENEYIVISSSRYFKEMHEQLVMQGILEEKIIHFGKYQKDLVQKQYFDLEYLVEDTQGEVFVDGGCYDGSTAENFVDWCKYKENIYIYAFEPDQENIVKCKKRLDLLEKPYSLIEKGLWSSAGELKFISEGNVGSRISGSGAESIKVVSIDEELKDEKVTFIKMDIEGAELQALIGAEQHIRKYRPKLAISVYHKPNDIWEIPKLLLEYNPEYRFYLRHYSLSWGDSVLYAI